MASTPADLLTRMRTVDPSSPRLVWHGTQGRIELSGRVFDNWAAKSSNLLADELDASQGTILALDLPVHWKTLALAFACWQTGGVILLPADDAGRAADPGAPGTPVRNSAAWLDAAGIVLSSREVPEVRPPRLLVGVALGTLALGWDGAPLPSGAVDFAAEVRAQGDVYPDAHGGDAGAVLVRVGDREITREGLVECSLLPDADSASGATTLLEPGTGLLETLATACSAWERDGAIVLVEEGVPVTEGMLTGERITTRLGSA